MSQVTRKSLELRDQQANDLLTQLETAQKEVRRIERLIEAHQYETDFIRSQVYFIQFDHESLSEALFCQIIAYDSVDEAKSFANASIGLSGDKLAYRVRSMLYPFETKFDSKQTSEV